MLTFGLSRIKSDVDVWLLMHPSAAVRPKNGIKMWRGLLLDVFYSPVHFFYEVPKGTVQSFLRGVPSNS